MSLYDKSSLIQVPSLYKDGTLVSTIPEDRSGDFTVARGSNLAATRIGEDGYIKKGYENLLLQSNSFDTSPWVASSVILTSGQLGYDGSNNAWLVTKNGSGFRNVYQNSNQLGVATLTVYAKEGTTNWMRLTHGGNTAYFDLSGSGAVGATSNGIDQTITSVGNGWFRCTLTANRTVAGQVPIYPYTAEGDTSGLTDSIYIQDAQLNQGLVAYPYLETTTATVYSGLLENTPRLDWSNGVPAVLVEEQRTNLITQSEYFNYSGYTTFASTFTDNATTSPEGLQNAAEMIGDGTTGSTFFRENLAVPSTGQYTYSLFAKYKANSDATNIYLNFADYSSGNGSCFFDIENGVKGTESGVTGGIEEYGNGWYRCYITTNFTDGADLSGRVQFYLADSSESLFFTPNNANAEAYFYGIQVEEGSYPTSYIPTYGTTQTRSNEVISDNFDIPTTATIYNSFYSDTAETVFVLDQVFNVAEGLNKVAIAFSPTAVKISVGGSIVANATGTYDTTALSNIQLGSNNGTDYSNAPISGFYVFPEFLTDEELNSLTD